MAEALTVTVCFSPAPREVFECTLCLPAGSTLADALMLARQQARWPAEGQHPPGFAGLSLGIWGRKARADEVLRAGDRVELYRSLRVDPKVARRERFARQGARRAGLFARQRPGSPDPT
jgi:uncharacterized protein